VVLFVGSAFRHGFREEDFFEVLETGPMKVRSRRGLENVYELYGQNDSGDHLHIAYRREPDRWVVFHLRRMDAGEKQWYRRNRS
jgi:hypothetical protein